MKTYGIHTQFCILGDNFGGKFLFARGALVKIFVLLGEETISYILLPLHENALSDYSDLALNR